MFCKRKNKFTNSHISDSKTDIPAIGHHRLILFEDVYVFQLQCKLGMLKKKTFGTALVKTKTKAHVSVLVGAL